MLPSNRKPIFATKSKATVFEYDLDLTRHNSFGIIIIIRSKITNIKLANNYLHLPIPPLAEKKKKKSALYTYPVPEFMQLWHCEGGVGLLTDLLLGHWHH